MIFATSDLHGYPPDDFFRLLDKAGFSGADRLYVIGDVIDRNGDGGVALLRWMARQENVTLIRGNHEVMMLACGFLFGPDFDPESPGKLSAAQAQDLLLWHENGAAPTVRSLMKLKAEEPDALQELVNYVREAPLFLELAVPMKRFVLVHGGLNGFSPEKRLDEYGSDDLVWTRPDPEARYWEDRTVILGHTPTWFYGKRGQMYATDTWIDIDTGAAGGGSPMLLRLDDMKPFYGR